MLEVNASEEIYSSLAKWIWCNRTVKV